MYVTFIDSSVHAADCRYVVARLPLSGAGVLATGGGAAFIRSRVSINCCGSAAMFCTA